MISFTVPGKSVSQGSLTPVPTNRNWRTVPGVRWTVRDAKADLKPWRKAVADAAREAYGDELPLEIPVRVQLQFIFERPQSHFFARKDGRVLRPDAPLYVVSHQLGDLDKHVRAIYDALTGVVIKDDCLVASGSESKVYGSHPMAIVQVTPLGG